MPAIVRDLSHVANVYQCDEGRPGCRLCALSARECSYPSQPIPKTARALQPAIGGKKDTIRGDCIRKQESRSPENEPSKALDNAPPATSIALTLEALSLTPSEDEAVNRIHAELLVHLIAEGFDLLGNATAASPTAFFTYAIQRGLECPYLLCQLLALSARHLSFTRSTQSHEYFNQALALQTSALSLFNEGIVALNESNCVDVMLFSVMLGHHLLADTLAVGASGSSGLDDVVQASTVGLSTYRGIRAIILLLRPTMRVSSRSGYRNACAMSESFLTSEPRGKYCQLLYDMIQRNGDFSSEERDSLLLMTNFLQLGIDAILRDETSNRNLMIYSWPMLAPEQFVIMVEDKRPEALVLMAWYCALLHHGRSMWQVGGAGAHILHLISGYLGQAWSFALEYPTEVIEGERQ